MEIKTNKIYYRVKKNYSSERFNSRVVNEFQDYEKAKECFEICKKTYLKMSKEQQTSYTYFLCEVLNGDEDVIAYFGMGLEFNERPVWVSYRFRNHQKEG